MKRVTAAVIITILIITLAFSGRWISQNSIRQIQTTMEQIDTALTAGDSEEALKMSKNLLQNWERHHTHLYFFLQHDHLDALESVFALLPFYIQQGEITLARKECRNIQTETDHLLKAETVTLENIL